MSRAKRFAQAIKCAISSNLRLDKSCRLDIYARPVLTIKRHAAPYPGVCLLVLDCTDRKYILEYSRQTHIPGCSSISVHVLYQPSGFHCAGNKVIFIREKVRPVGHMDIDIALGAQLMTDRSCPFGRHPWGDSLVLRPCSNESSREVGPCCKLADVLHGSYNLSTCSLSLL